MDAVCVGIDVSKDRLDVHVLPSGEAFAVTRDGAGIADLCARLAPLAPGAVALLAVTSAQPHCRPCAAPTVSLPAIKLSSVKCPCASVVTRVR